MSHIEKQKVPLKVRLREILEEWQRQQHAGMPYSAESLLQRLLDEIKEEHDFYHVLLTGFILQGQASLHLPNELLESAARQSNRLQIDRCSNPCGGFVLTLEAREGWVWS
jgi:hypothetical protein